MAFENITLQIDGAVAVLTLNRPKALNALNTKTLEELQTALDQLRATDGLRVLILTGAGEKAFVAGADIAELSALHPTQALLFSQLGHRVMAGLEALPVATIAAVNGYALGGGLELALACDLVYASDKAKLGLPEVSLAVIPGFGGTQRLTRTVGRMRAKELIFTGDPVDAHRAKELGLVLDVRAPQDLMPFCRQVAATIANRGPLAIGQSKRVIEAGADLPLKDANELERQAFALMFGSKDQKEGMKAFLEKRAPVFTGD
jgi:enoyl-CoA hydratase